MENFIVSARKYRPATFTSVAGQSSITTTLKNAIKNNHLAHAYLFCGPRGVGKTTCARIFAKTINCKNLPGTIEACNECESCTTFNKSTAYNIHELDAASNNSVEDIRNLIDQVRIPPQVGKYSIYIIDEVHMLSAQAFNAFLKTLEEPPAHAIFILATTEKHKIIPTILSRCQIFDFNRIKVSDIVEYLEHIAGSEGIKCEAEALNIIAQKADGAMRDALSIFDQVVSFSGKEITYKNVIENLNVLDLEYYFTLTDKFLNEDISGALIVFNEIQENGFDAHHFIAGLSEHFRNLLVSKDTVTLQLLETSEGTREKYQQQSAASPLEFLFEALKITNACDLGYKVSQNKRLHVELALIQLCTAQQGKKKEHELTSNNRGIVSPKKDSFGITSKPSRITGQSTTSSPPQIMATPSIKDILSGKKQAVVNEPQKEYAKGADITTDNARDFTEAEMLSKWKAFTESIKLSRRRLYSMLTANSPKLKENCTIEFVINNTLQQDEINEIRFDLLKFLRQELNNGEIEFTTIINEEDNQELKLYTTKDKFDYMGSKNDHLKLLKQKLNLDFE